MDKTKKKTIILIAISALIVFVLAMFALTSRINSGKTSGTDTKRRYKSLSVSDTLINDSTRVTRDINPRNLCYDKLCIDKVVISAYENEGIISLILSYDRDGTVGDISPIEADYLKLIVEGHSLYIYHDGMRQGESVNIEVGYDGFDLRNARNFELDELTMEEYGKIINE